MNYTDRANWYIPPEKKVRVLHHSDELAQIGKLAMHWLNSGEPYEEAVLKVTKLLAQAAAFPTAESKKDISEAIKQYKSVRLQMWVRQFLVQEDQADGVFIDHYEAIDVDLEEFWHELITEFNDETARWNPDFKLAVTILSFCEELPPHALLMAEPSDNFHFLLDELIVEEALIPQDVIYWHWPFSMVLFKHGANMAYWLSKLDSCDCEYTQLHKRDGAACTTRRCTDVLHHKCCLGLAIGLENLGLQKAIVNMMMSYAEFFLHWDVAQAMLQNRGHGLTILRFCSRLDMSSATVGKSMLQMCLYAKQHQSWIWDVYFQER